MLLANTCVDLTFGSVRAQREPRHPLVKCPSVLRKSPFNSRKHGANADCRLRGSPPLGRRPPPLHRGAGALCRSVRRCGVPQLLRRLVSTRAMPTLRTLCTLAVVVTSHCLYHRYAFRVESFHVAQFLLDPFRQLLTPHVGGNCSSQPHSTKLHQSGIGA